MIPRTGITVSKKELLFLLVIFIVYVLLGGLVFMLLERPLEEKLRKEIAELRDEFQEKLDQLGHGNVTREHMEGLMLRLAVASGNSFIDEEGNDTHINWSFENSFFFAITVVTTIGYGHLSPSTTPGRLFCVVYAILGIPLTGILLAAIGGHFSQHLVRRLQRVRKSRHSRLALTFSAAKCLLPWLLVFLVLPACLFMFSEGWSFVEGFYYCFITLSTIGFGDYVAGNFEGRYVGFYKTGVVLWIIFGLGYLAMILNYISRMMRCKQIRRVERKLSSSIYQTQQKMGQRLEEVYQILQDVSKTRGLKNRNRGAIKRMQSFPAPELSRDRNHNHKIQRLLNLVQNLKEEEPPPRPRRLSLPLPVSPQLPLQNQGRGSLQVFGTAGHPPELLRNGFQSKSPKEDSTVTSGGIEIVVPTVTRRPKSSWASRNVEIVDVISAEPPRDIDGRTIIDIEGLQCTRV